MTTYIHAYVFMYRQVYEQAFCLTCQILRFDWGLAWVRESNNIKRIPCEDTVE